jgi:dihydroneopterin aldolase
MDIIYIKNLKGKTIIGICDDELHVPQEITLDISMGVSKIKACSSDNIAHTIDYDKVRSLILETMGNHNFKLLESFAEKIANLILDNFGAHWVKINVAKPKKYDDVDSVGIVIERNKELKKQTNIFNKTQHILKVIGAGHVPKNK